MSRRGFTSIIKMIQVTPNCLNGDSARMNMNVYDVMWSNGFIWVTKKIAEVVQMIQVAESIK